MEKVRVILALDLRIYCRSVVLMKSDEVPMLINIHKIRSGDEIEYLLFV